MRSANLVRVKVPASTSNLGSGFDTLGLAVDLYLEVCVERASDGGLRIDPASASAASADPLVREAAQPFASAIPHAVVRVTSEIPVGRGLGASAALRAGVVAAFAELAEEPFDRQKLLERVYRLEHHPDNASPAIFGGFTVSGFVEGQVRCFRFPVDPRLKLVTLLPPFEMPTGEARQLLPAQYSKADAAHSLNRSALIVAAMSRQDYAALNGLFDDLLHQPYRQKLLPQLSAVIQAGVRAGAIGGFLSGAGSAIICLALENEERISHAMLRAMPEAVVRVFLPENNGLARC